MTDENNSNENNGNEGEWQSALPEFARNWPEVQQAKDLESLFNSFGEQRSHLGRSIKIPGEDAGDSDWQEFNTKLMNKVPTLMQTPDLENQESVNALLKKLGRPDEAKDYIFESDDVAFGDGKLEEMKVMALDLGLTKAQFKKLAENVGQQGQQILNDQADQNKSELSRIQEEWGLSAEAKYQETVNYAKQSNMPKHISEALANKQLDAETVFWLNSIAKNSSEANNQDFNSGNSNGFSMTPSEAQSSINEILSNPEHGYHRGDKGARGRMHELMQMADPTKDYGLTG